VRYSDDDDWKAIEDQWLKSSDDIALHISWDVVEIIDDERNLGVCKAA